jgi:hypothetical protein
MLQSYYAFQYSRSFLMVAFFVLNILTTYNFIENVIKTLIDSLIDVAKFLKKTESILNIRTETNVNFEEVENLVGEILYYYQILFFIKR